MSTYHSRNFFEIAGTLVLGELKYFGLLSESYADNQQNDREPHLASSALPVPDYQHVAILDNILLALQPEQTLFAQTRIPA